MESKTVPVLYILDDDGEAYGVRYFCGTWCREQYEIKSEESLSIGQSADAIEGTVCDECGGAL